MNESIAQKSFILPSESLIGHFCVATIFGNGVDSKYGNCHFIGPECFQKRKLSDSASRPPRASLAGI